MPLLFANDPAAAPVDATETPLNELPSAASLGVAFYMLLLLGLCAAAWVVAATKKHQHGMLLAPDGPRQRTAWGFADVAVVIVLWIVAQFVGVQAAAWFAGLKPGSVSFEEMSPEQSTILIWTTAAVEWAALVPILLWLWVRSRFESQALGVRWTTLPNDIGLGLIAYVMVIPPVLTVQTIASQLFPEQTHPFIEAIVKTPQPQLMAAIFFSAVVTAPVFEEFLFRLAIQGWLDQLQRDGWTLATETTPNPTRQPQGKAEGAVTEVNATQGDTAKGGVEPELPTAALQDEHAFVGSTPFRKSYVPIAIASLLFAAVHLGHGPAPISLFFFALALGYLYQRTGRITPCIVLHFALNAQTTVLLFVQAWLPQPTP